MHSHSAWRATVIVPTYQGGAVWKESAKALSSAVRASERRIDVLVMDSSSTDDTVQVAEQYGFRVQSIPKPEFDHGGTRNRAVRAVSPDTDIVIFLTQDAILAHRDALAQLMKAFDDPSVAVAYGRQLPHSDANPIAKHARRFNYGPAGHVAGLEAKATRGLKTVFTSNAFAAYRLSVFKQLGGFPERAILSEDMYYAARAALAGHKIAYEASALCKHSHNYTPAEELRRYFDIGVFHHDEDWIAQAFGGAGGEGKRFLLSEIRYLLAHAPLWIPRACLHNALKIVGYKLGKHHTQLPLAWRKRLSMHKGYWGGQSA